MQINQPEFFSSDGITSRSGGRLGTKNHIIWFYFHIGRTKVVKALSLLIRFAASRRNTNPTIRTLNGCIQLIRESAI